MIHAYDEYYLAIAKQKLGSMFEIAVYHEKLDIDQFAEKFMQSPVSKAIEIGNPIYLEGKSANELLGIVLHKPPIESEQNMFASPEYWVGFILAFCQWYLNKPFEEIIKAYPLSSLLLNYFPYHEMEETKTVELIEKHLPRICPLKAYRKKNHISQSQLALLSQVPLRSIKAYEQNKIDISKAHADTLYRLSKVLNCTIEDLII